ncbi:MAG: hypothetical protein QXG00_02225 [Candidatus Woesearchaeota archaeon]
MNNKISTRILIICLLFLNVIITSCNRPAQLWTAVGKEGLKIEFDKANPPPRIYVGDQTDVIIRIRNVGATDINEETRGFVLSLIKDDYYMKAVKDISYDQIVDLIDGSSPYFSGGNMKQYNMGTYITVLPEQSESTTTEITANICYPYKTKLSQAVCIDNDKYGQSLRKQSCKATTINIGTKGQGAPIGITKIEPEMLSLSNKTRPSFRITIQNLGAGTVYTSIVNASICALDRPALRDYNSVRIKAFLASRIPLNCTPEKVRLINNIGETICRIDMNFITNEMSFTYPNYITNLDIELNYEYFQSLTKSIEIFRP